MCPVSFNSSVQSFHICAVVLISKVNHIGLFALAFGRIDLESINAKNFDLYFEDIFKKINVE